MKTKWLCRLLVLLFGISLMPAVHAQDVEQRWSEKQANQWYEKQPWLVGANYIPADAINEFEMFQPETFHPALIDKEFGMAEGIGMNTMRVFLQDQLYLSDPEGFKKRLNEFLEIAARHHIRPLLVLFDSCWEPNPHSGPQHPPIPGVHNSGWVQSPGTERLMNRAVEPELKAYVQGVVKAFGKDERVLGWDVWNEPDNGNGRFHEDVAAKVKRVNELLPKVFAWAREMHPMQPLTSGVWQGQWGQVEKRSATARIQLAESDVVSFHSYGWPEEFMKRIHELRGEHRPILCTEYMARGAGSTFDGTLPIGKREHVALINWGLVAGKTQTYFPWDSWTHPYVLSEPTVWFHEVFRQDGMPYRRHETELIRYYTGRGTPLSADEEKELDESAALLP